MKKLIKLSFILFPLSLLGSFSIYAQAVVGNVISAPAPDSIDTVISFVLGIAAGIPAIGSYLAMALKIAGIVAAVMTAVSSLLMALSGVLNVAGLSTVKSYIDKILPYVQYFSVYNVQKPQA